MDFMNRECNSVDFTRNIMHNKRFSGKTTLLNTRNTKKYTYSAIVYPIISDIDYVIDSSSMRAIQLPKPKILKYIPQEAYFTPNRASINTKLLFWDNSNRSKLENEFPILVENGLINTVIWKKGKIGYLAIDIKSGRSDEPNYPTNYSAFIGTVLEYQIPQKSNYNVPNPIKLDEPRKDNNVCPEDSLCQGVLQHNHKDKNLISENLQKLQKPIISADLPIKLITNQINNQIFCQNYRSQETL